MQFFQVPTDWEMVRLIMLCQAVSAKVLQSVCVCVSVCVGVWGCVCAGGWVGGGRGGVHTTWPLYKAAPTLG